VKIVCGKRPVKIKDNIKMMEVTDIKGNPKEYVDNMIAKNTDFQVIERFLVDLAKTEETTYPINRGVKMGTRIFWRNSYAYFKNIQTKKVTQ
jgi:hypothetical protein